MHVIDASSHDKARLEAEKMPILRPTTNCVAEWADLDEVSITFELFKAKWRIEFLGDKV
jgi:hypothetical protein